MKHRSFHLGFLISIAVACGAGLAHAVTADDLGKLRLGPERQRILEEGAKKEGKLIIYTTSTGQEKVTEAFMKKVPFVKVDLFVSRGEPLTQRVLAEARAGRLGGDLLRTNVNIYENLEDLLVPFNSPRAKFDHVPKGAVYSFGGIGFTYSKPRAKPGELPQRVEDLLAPRWKGRIGLFVRPNNYPGRWVGTLTHILGEEQTKSFLKRLSDQNPYFYAQPTAGRSGLLAGEYDINMQGLTSGFVAMSQGEPTGVLALDPTTLSANLIAFFKQSQNPHAALLFIDWLLGEGAVVSSEVEGSWTPEEVEKRQKGELKLPKRVRVELARDVDHLKNWMDLFQQLVVRK